MAYLYYGPINLILKICLRVPDNEEKRKMNIRSIWLSIKNFLFMPVPEKYKREINKDIERINITRAKVTAAAFIVIEIISLAAFWATKRQKLFKAPNIYYFAMYFLMFIAMAGYLAVFIHFTKNMTQKIITYQIAAVCFISFILLWCAGISLLDQLSYGQLIVYAAAIISVAVCPILEPAALLFMYIGVHMVFIILMPYFQKDSGILFGNYVNSTTFIIISWTISCMRYRNYIENFKNRKLLQEKSEELESLNKKLEKLSRTDSLTGVFNRFMFDRSLKREWDRCKRQFTPLSLMIIDIDYFKSFNDNYGHQAGDDCIRKVAGVLSTCARRSSDIVTRYGGDEFAIILPYMDRQNVYSLAEQIRKGIEEVNIEHMYSPISNCVTISLGANTIIPSDKSSIDEFIRTADIALYEAKEKDRNNVVIA